MIRARRGRTDLLSSTTFGGGVGAAPVAVFRRRTFDGVSQSQRLAVVLGLNLALVAALVIVGVTAHSLGVLAAGVDKFLWRPWTTRILTAGITG
jgi:hypothetical protein